MRVAIAAHSATRAGGVEQYVATIAPALLDAGHDVACWFERATADRHALVERGDEIPCLVAGDRPDAALEALREWRPDVVYSHGLASLESEQALVELAPAVAFAHSYYGTCISGTKMHLRPIQQCCDRRFSARCLVQYYPQRCGGWSPITIIRQFHLQRGRLRLLASYRRIVVASQHMADEYATHGLRDKVRVISLPIEASSWHEPRPRSPDVWRLLYLGRLEETKGAHIALESAAIVASSVRHTVELRMSGEGTLRDRLTARAARLMRQRPNLSITFTGWLREDDCAEALAWTQLLLVPSCWPEPFGMVGVEAALRGVPAVAFAVGGIPEWLADGINGRLVAGNPPDATRFADAIQSILSDPRQFRRSPEDQMRMTARFRLPLHVRQLEGVLQEAVGASSVEGVHQ